MPLNQTITIINNSGKIISTGKHLVGIFKEAKAAYREKKEALRQEKEARSTYGGGGGFRRAHTFHGPGPYVEEFDSSTYYDDGHFERDAGGQPRRLAGVARQPLFLESSQVVHRRSSRSSFSTSTRPPPVHRSSSVGGRSNHRFRPSRRDDRYRDDQSRDGQTRDDRESRDGRDGRDGQRGRDVWGRGRSRRDESLPPLPSSNRSMLTERNLRTHSEIAATTPSTLPARPYRRDPVDGARGLPAPPTRSQTYSQYHTASQAVATPAVAARTPGVSRPRSDPTLRDHSDVHLAYGNIPPDLSTRYDLDPVGSRNVGLVGPGGSPAMPGDGHLSTEDEGKAKAQSLIDYIESLLNEAQCIHHTAAAIIAHLQESPEAAAAVALTLAELSALLAKLSPAFLGVVKGGSPAVFALLASPQFLIGTSIAVGVTVIAFGGWKIVKRITDGKMTERPMAAASAASTAPDPQRQQQQQQQQQQEQHHLPLAGQVPPPTVLSGGFDEALVLEEELSAIESWRRGIVMPADQDNGIPLDELPPGHSAFSVADIELISPEAMRSRIGFDLDDQRTLRSVRTSRRSSGHGHASGHAGGHGSGRSSHESRKHVYTSSAVYERDPHRDRDRDNDAATVRSSRSRHHSSSKHDPSRGHGDENNKSIVPVRKSSKAFGETKTPGTAAAASAAVTATSSPQSSPAAPPSEAGSKRSSRRLEKPALSESILVGSSISISTSEVKKEGGSGNMLKQLFKKKRDKDMSVVA